jgi:uncharacterized membrane protein
VIRHWTDVDVARVVSAILRGGLGLASIVAGAAGLVYLLHHGSDRVAYATFRSEPQTLRSIGGIVHGVMRGETPAIIQLGLLLLIATPIARVALSLLGFYLERDRRYMVITALVLTILLFSLLGRV